MKLSTIASFVLLCSFSVPGVALATSPSAHAQAPTPTRPKIEGADNRPMGAVYRRSGTTKLEGGAEIKPETTRPRPVPAVLAEKDAPSADARPYNPSRKTPYGDRGPSYKPTWKPLAKIANYNLAKDRGAANPDREIEFTRSAVYADQRDEGYERPSYRVASNGETAHSEVRVVKLKFENGKFKKTSDTGQFDANGNEIHRVVDGDPSTTSVMTGGKIVRVTGPTHDPKAEATEYKLPPNPARKNVRLSGAVVEHYGLDRDSNRISPTKHFIPYGYGSTDDAKRRREKTQAAPKGQ